MNTKNKIALSFDIEDWFTVRNMREFISESDWSKQESRVNIGVDYILGELNSRNIKATFFILGREAEINPNLILKIKNAGHEIASHGYSHKPIDLMSKEEFEKDLLNSKNILKKITGLDVVGFRAPSFSITKKTKWALDVLEKCNFKYDSSIFSTRHPDYGVKNFPKAITRINNLLEIPLIKSIKFGISIPVCGGGYFRILPYFLTRIFLKETLKNQSIIMYFHPWEFDENQPIIKMKFFKKFRHYVGLKKNRKKFEKLLDDFNFSTIESEIFKQEQANKILEYSFN